MPAGVEHLFSHCRAQHEGALAPVRHSVEPTSPIEQLTKATKQYVRCRQPIARHLDVDSASGRTRACRAETHGINDRGGAWRCED